METNKNAFLVGLFVLGLMAAALGFTLWITVAGKGETAPYRIHFTESVGGLKVGSNVTFLGVNVGTVDKMEVDPDNTKQVTVDMDILKKAPVKTGTTGTLKLQGLTGDVYVELSGGEASEPNLADVSHDNVPEIQSTPSSINTIMTKLPQILEKTNLILDKVNHIAGQIDKVFNDQNIKAINSVMHTLAKHFGSSDDNTPIPPKSGDSVTPK